MRVLGCGGSGSLEAYLAGLDWVYLNHKYASCPNAIHSLVRYLSMTMAFIEPMAVLEMQWEQADILTLVLFSRLFARILNKD